MLSRTTPRTIHTARLGLEVLRLKVVFPRPTTPGTLRDRRDTRITGMSNNASMEHHSLSIAERLIISRINMATADKDPLLSAHPADTPRVSIV